MKTLAATLIVTAALLSPRASADAVIYDNSPESPSACCSYGFGPAGSGNIVSDTFTLTGNDVVTGFDLYVWMGGGTSLTSLDWAFGTTFGDDSLGSGTADGSSIASSPVLQTGNAGSVPLDLYEYSLTGLSTALGAGTYWLSLSNGTPSSGTYVSWDTYLGSGCAGTAGGSDCPSTAMTFNPGSGWFGIASEAFDIVGSSAPEPATLVLCGAGLIFTLAEARRSRTGRG